MEKVKLFFDFLENLVGRTLFLFFSYFAQAPSF